MNFALSDPIAVDFRERVSEQAEQVDARQEEDWHSLAVGFALGKGLNPRDARAWADWASRSHLL